jgi:Spy/CpxP family protein refolding chaperone
MNEGRAIGSFTENLRSFAMKSIRLRLLVAGLVVLVGTAIARSQSTEAPPPGPPMHGPGPMGEHMLNYYIKALNLTEDQQTQAKTILNNAKPAFKSLMQQQHQIDQQLHSQAEGTFDAKQVQSLAAQKAQIQQQMTVAETQLHHQMYQLLTSDQQTQLKQIEAEHQARMQQRMQEQEAAPAAPEQ